MRLSERKRKQKEKFMDLNRKRMNAGITAEDNRSELSAGSTVTLEITAYGSEGQGIARHNGMAVFVPGAICGETVEAEIKKPHPRLRKRNFKKSFGRRQKGNSALPALCRMRGL